MKFLSSTILFFLIVTGFSYSQNINKDLFGIFFEDINYSADGGLYAELVQNRSFEYAPVDRSDWNSFTAWDYYTPGFSYGNISVESSNPLHENNPHYILLTIEETGKDGLGLKNSGYDGMVIQKGEKYNFSAYFKPCSGATYTVSVRLLDSKDKTIADTVIVTDSENWKKYTVSLTPSVSCDSASLALVVKNTGKLAIDEVSLFPENTFNHRINGLRADLAKAIADLKPKFMRFPGGCLVHGDGLGNMYNWKNTIGPVEQRVQQKNIWRYHQSVGLGYFEFFQFCEDIGAKPLPVLAAGVSCQNSGGTWRIGRTGQKGIPMEAMSGYVQDVLDLIEYANGSETSVWGSKRAAAGHPKPFNLEYIGIGNEDKITPEFEERFKMIYNAVAAKYPGIKVIGTVGPAPDGDDYDKGWQIANQLNVPLVDEHYYMKPDWFLKNQHRYDSYNRKKSKVYIGEYASKGNTLYNALAEAVYMISLERNGDIVQLASYAPLLAKKGHTQWNPDLIYFDNKSVCLTANYYVQQMFSCNQGDRYIPGIIKVSNDSTLAASAVIEGTTGDLIIKIANAGTSPANVVIDLSKYNNYKKIADIIDLTGKPEDKNSFSIPDKIKPVKRYEPVESLNKYTIQASCFSVIRIKK